MTLTHYEWENAKFMATKPPTIYIYIYMIVYDLHIFTSFFPPHDLAPVALLHDLAGPSAVLHAARHGEVGHKGP